MKLTPTAGLLGFGAKSLTGLTYSAVPNIWPLGSAGLNYSSLEQLKTFQGGACVNGFLYRWEKNLLNKSGVPEDEWSKINKKFDGASGHAKGCVAVSWNKETYEGDKWKGAIRYEWLYTIGGETLVTYGLWTTDNNDNRWKTVYINRHTSTSAWKLWSLDKEKMPQSPNFLYKGGSYFGFNPDFGKVCTSSDCAGGAKATKSEAIWSWDADGHGGKKFSDWISNWDSLGLLTWLSDLSQFMELAKQEGTWTKR